MSPKHFALILSLAMPLAVGCEARPSIDQLGGTRLVYKIEKPSEPFEPEVVTRKLRQRLDPSKKAGIQVAIHDNSLEVSVPDVEGVDLDKIKSLVTTKATLELMILAELRDAQLLAAVEAKEAAGQDKPKSNVEADGKLLGRWIPISAEPSPAIQVSPDNLSRKVDGITQILCVASEVDISSQHFDSGSKGIDDSQRPVINFTLTDDGATKMAKLTGANFGRRLAVIFGGRIVSAPTIQSTIQDRGQISGQFTEQEVDELVSIMAAGPLPFKCESESPQVIKVEPKK